MNLLQITGWLVCNAIAYTHRGGAWILNQIASGALKASEGRDARTSDAKRQTRRASDKLGGPTSNI